MKRENNRAPSSVFLLFCSLKAIVLIAILCVFYGCNNPSDGKRRYGVAAPTLSPDNGSILFILCDPPSKCDIASYEIATKKLTRTNPTRQKCLAPIYSPDGKMIAFGSGLDDDLNIFVMNADGSNVRQLTHTVNTKNPLKVRGESIVHINAVPSFSLDNTKIIFIRSGVRRQRNTGGEMLSHWDFYEVDIATGAEKQLTDLSYYVASRPFYLPDGQGFIFSGTGPKGTDLPIGINPNFNENQIMIMERGKAYPRLAFEHPTYAVEPSVARDGAIAFVSRSNEFDGNTYDPKRSGGFFYDLFLRKDGKTTRLTRERFRNISDPLISSDGSLVVFFAYYKPEEGSPLWLVKTDGTGLTYIGRPWDQVEEQKK